ncbi:MAG: CHAD domain-containing protein [Eubacteriales bacterium]
MTSQIIFIRHGIAEAGFSGKSDFERCLTNKGKQKLQDTLPFLLPLLNHDREIMIWSSPLVRARETAAIAAGIFRVEEIEVYDFIEEGYFDEFWNTVGNLSPSVDRTIIVVGHEPTMGYWSQALCGVCLPFKKGAAASVAYRAGGPETAELQWFLQPEGMEMLSRKTNSSKILGDISDTLQRHLHQVVLERDNFLGEPENPESAHQLRVSIRKLRSLLFFLKPFQKDKQNASIQGNLKKLVTEFSYLRELDVLSDACSTFSKEHQEAMAADSSIFGILREERAQEAQRVISVVSTAECVDSLYDMGVEIQKMPWKKNIDENESIAARINERFADLFDTYKRSAADVDYNNTAATHALRIKTKKLRYILLGLEPLMEGRFGNIGTELKEAHDKLGQLCDARRNKDILQNFDSGELPEKAHLELRALIDCQDGVVNSRLDQLKKE